MSNNLTDKEFWEKFWASKENEVVRPIPANFFMHKIFSGLFKKIKPKTAIELGGFPGQYSIYLKKHLSINPTMLDYIVYKPLFNKLLATNGLSEGDVKVIEADLFTYQPTTTYDLVYSLGLIEHFEDTKDVIAKHLPYMNANGTLFILLPNFTGVNGWVQKTFDRAIYDVHNISSMDVELLRGICNDLGLKNIDVKFDGGFSVWLEEPDKKSLFVKGFVKSIWIIGKVFNKVLPFESKFLSPYITITATKS